MEANYDPWSTHVPALALAVLKYGKRVLEVGAGWYSTPLLHTMSDQVYTIETDANWAKKFDKLTPGGIHVVSDIMAAAKVLALRDWDVVFIDCEGNHFRVWIADLFLNRNCCIVAHDTQEGYWQPVLDRTRYVRHFDFNLPRTSHLSNARDILE